MIHPFLFFEKYILPDMIMLYFYVGSNSVGTCTCSHVYVCRSNRQNYILYIASLSIQNSSEMFACFNGLQIINILAIII